MDILLVEDRVDRMEQLSNFEIKEDSKIDFVTGKNFKALMDKIDKKDFVKVEEYKCLIFHRSALSNNQKENLKEFCENKNKALVFFSGGISSSFYNDKPFPYLNINSKEFYSNNLKIFLDDYNSDEEINLLKLQYGNGWFLNSLLILRNDIIKKEHENNIQMVGDLGLNNYQIEKMMQNFEFKWLTNEYASIENPLYLNFKNKLDTLIIESI